MLFKIKILTSEKISFKANVIKVLIMDMKLSLKFFEMEIDYFQKSIHQFIHLSHLNILTFNSF